MTIICTLLSIVGIISILYILNHYIDVFITWKSVVKKSIRERHHHFNNLDDTIWKLAKLEIEIKNLRLELSNHKNLPVSLSHNHEIKKDLKKWSIYQLYY